MFFWRASPSLDVVGLGQFLRARLGQDGETRFTVRYLTPALNKPVGIQELRRDRIIGGASFLKAGPAGTVFPLTQEQGERLYGIICRRDASNAASVWPDLWSALRSDDPLLDIDVLDISAREGRRRLVAHLRLERNRGLIESKKRAVLQTTGRLACEVCQFDFLKFYGPRGMGFCEVHHKMLLSGADGERTTQLDDLAIVCSNCHRMLHHGRRMISIRNLRRLVQQFASLGVA